MRQCNAIGKPSRALSILRYVAHALTGTLYLVSRIYILVEPFIGLRNFEEGVYGPVTWAQYWPHVQ